MNGYQLTIHGITAKNAKIAIAENYRTRTMLLRLLNMGGLEWDTPDARPLFMFRPIQVPGTLISRNEAPVQILVKRGTDIKICVRVLDSDIFQAFFQGITHARRTHRSLEVGTLQFEPTVMDIDIQPVFSQPCPDQDPSIFHISIETPVFFRQNREHSLLYSTSQAAFEHTIPYPTPKLVVRRLQTILMGSGTQKHTKLPQEITEFFAQFEEDAWDNLVRSLTIQAIENVQVCLARREIRGTTEIFPGLLAEIDYLIGTPALHEFGHNLLSLTHWLGIGSAAGMGFGFVTTQK